MKVLIVDDEKHVREGIRLLGAWEENGIKEIFEAGNGEEAVQLIQKHRPEIIFSDMKMPKMDGTQLLEWIKENQPASKTIVVTGYDDYYYMRKAIHSGSSDYLLKPVDPEILNTTLRTVVSDWKKEEEARKSKESSSLFLNEMKPVYRDRKLTKLLNRDVIQEDLYEELGFNLSRKYQIALMWVNGKTFEAFQGDRDLTYFTLLNVINEIVIEKECGIGFRYLTNKGQIVIIFWDKFELIEDMLVRIYRTLMNVMGISCPVAVGKSVNGRSEFLESYQHARQILMDRNILSESEDKVYVKEIKPDHDIKSLMNYSSSIELAVQAGEIEAFEDLISGISSDFSKNNYLTIRQLFHFENEYIVISNHWYKHFNVPFKVSNDFEHRIETFFNQNGTFQLEEYKNKIKREIAVFLKKVKRSTSQKNTNIIYEIEKYLQANFDRDVKLQEISDHFYISREYISRKFKQEFNVNISEYIVTIRMSKAKSLLKNSQLKIYEIANMIGYQDDKYFRKVFKKVVGITPNEFRAEIINQ